jgi:hypothetical protein
MITRISFELGLLTLDFERNISYSSHSPEKSHQVIDMNAAGGKIVQTLAPEPTRDFILVWNKMPESDFLGLENWIKNVVNYAAVPFTYNDENGVAWSVRYVSGQFDFQPEQGNYYSGTITLSKEY